MKNIFSFRNIFLAFAFVLAISFSQFFSVQAQLVGGQQIGQIGVQCNPTAYNVHGQIFHSTIGWIYLNCADYTNGITRNFGVQQFTDGTWSGYGWSSSMGWIKFGGVGCPPGASAATGATNCEVQHLNLAGASYPLVGWARACTMAPGSSGCGSNPTNSQPTTTSNDGWISMSGLNDQNWSAGGVQTTNKYVSNLGLAPNGRQPVNGYVWGGDVMGWGKFMGAYVDVNNSSIGVNITLTSSLASVTTQNVVLTYKMDDPTQKAYFTGQPCTATTTTTPVSGSPWDGSKANFSASSTTFSKDVQNVVVPAPIGSSTTYKISCPVSGIPNSTQSEAVATVTVEKTGLSGTLTIPTHDMCIAGSQGNPQNTTATWIGPAGAVTAKLFQDGVVTNIQSQQVMVGSMVLGPFTTATSSPNYVTPTAPGSHHEYWMEWYDASGTLLATSNNGQHEFLGVAPATFHGATANGTLDCTQAEWGISLGGGGIICPADPGTLAWEPWGTIPAQYTKAKLLLSTNGVNGAYSTTVGSHDRLRDSEPNVFLAGWYKVAYYDINGNEAPISSPPINVTLSPNDPSGGCSHHFNGITSAGPFCPAGSVNTAALLPKTYAWTSDAASCALNTMGGVTLPANGSTTISSLNVGSTSTRVLTCTWTDGFTATSRAVFGPMKTADSDFCKSIHKPGGYPSVIEN